MPITDILRPVEALLLLDGAGEEIGSNVNCLAAVMASLGNKGLLQYIEAGFVVNMSSKQSGSGLRQYEQACLDAIASGDESAQYNLAAKYEHEFAAQLAEMELIAVEMRRVGFFRRQRAFYFPAVKHGQAMAELHDLRSSIAADIPYSRDNAPSEWAYAFPSLVRFYTDLGADCYLPHAYIIAEKVRREPAREVSQSVSLEWA